jgi:hypothetical protein
LGNGIAVMSYTVVALPKILLYKYTYNNKHYNPHSLATGNVTATGIHTTLLSYEYIEQILDL